MYGKKEERGRRKRKRVYHRRGVEEKIREHNQNVELTNIGKVARQGSQQPLG